MATAEEENKKILKNTQELELATSKLPAAFKGVIDDLKSINHSVAKSASDIAKTSGDSFSSMLAARKSLKIQQQFKNDPEFIKVNTEVRESLARQTELEEERQDKLDIASKRENALGKLDAELAVMIEKSQHLQGAALNNQMKLIVDLEKTRKTTQEQILASVDKRLEHEKETSEKVNKAADEINQKKIKMMEDANESDSFSKFAKGVQTMTGGLIDIATPLDAALKQYTAFKDVFGMVGKGFKSISKWSEGYAEDGKTLSSERRESHDENLEAEEENTKTKKSIGQRLAMLLTGITGALLMIAVGILLPLLAIGAVIMALKMSFESEAFAGAAKGIEKALTKAGSVVRAGLNQVSKGWDKLSKGVKAAPTLFKKLFGKVDDVKPPVKPIPKPALRHPAGAVDPVTGKKIGGQFKKVIEKGAMEGTDDVIKAVSKTSGWWSKLKGGLSKVVKKLPIIGAAAEGALDLDEQVAKFAALKEAKEKGELKVKDAETGEMREMTDEEFGDLETAHEANIAGSGGQALGGWAGAAAGASAGAAGGAWLGGILGSVVPGLGTALGVAVGGFLGGVGGAIVGGITGSKIGDTVATTIAEQALGGEASSQQMIDQAVASNQLETDSYLDAAKDKYADWKGEENTDADKITEARNKLADETSNNNLITNVLTSNNSNSQGGAKVYLQNAGPTTDNDSTMGYAAS